MPYSAGKFPPSYKNVDPATRAKAVIILNSLLKDGGLDEGAAIATALTKARQSMKEHAAREYTSAIKGVEIFKTGTHNGDEYTEQDLDAMVGAFGKLDFKPALKVGHTKDAPGAPAYGWVQNLRREGQKLLADFTDMHDSVVDALRKRSYDRVSSEIYFNLKRAGQTFPRALKAVALLGAEVPAVAGLTPMHKMQFAAPGEFDSLAEHEQELQIADRALLESMSTRLTELATIINEQKELDTMTIKELNAKIKELTEKLAAVTSGDEDGKDEKLVEIKAELKALSEQAAALADLDSGDEKSRKELEASNKRIAELEANERRRNVADRVATLKVPAFKPAVTALYGYALEHAAVKVKVYSAPDKDGKVTETERTLAEIADTIVADINAQAERLFKTMTINGTVRAEGAELDDPQAEVDRRAKKLQLEKPTDYKSYTDAMNAVLAADPELDAKYRGQHAKAN